LAADRAHLLRRRVDILARPGPQAKMVQTHTVLDKSRALVLLRATLYSDRGASTNVIEKIVAVIDFRHPKEGQQFGVKRARLFPLANGQNHVRHAVDFNHEPSTS